MAQLRLAVPALVLGVTIGSWFVPAFAKPTADTPPAAQSRSEDVLPALLVEVRGLRAAMEQMASTGARSQLLVGRLQLQEGRINATIRRLDAIRDALGPARQEHEKAQTTLRMLEKPDPDAEGLAALATMFLKPEDGQRAVAERQATVTRLEQEEAQLVKQIAADQASWTEISRRLEELELTLSKR